MLYHARQCPVRPPRRPPLAHTNGSFDHGLSSPAPLPAPCVLSAVCVRVCNVTLPHPLPLPAVMMPQGMYMMPPPGFPRPPPGFPLGPPPGFPSAAPPVAAPPSSIEAPASAAPAKSPTEPVPVYVGKIPADCEDVFVTKLLMMCGPIAKWRRPTDESGRPKTFGYCDFATLEGVRKVGIPILCVIV